MFKIVKLEREQLMSALDDPLNIIERPAFSSELIEDILAAPLSGAVITDDGLVLVGGVTEYWPGRCQVWTVFRTVAKKNFVSAFRGIRKYLDDLPYERIEVCVPVGYTMGVRRAKLLGFKLECSLAKKFLGGEDYTLLALVR